MRCLYVTIWCKKVVIDVGGGFGPPECHSVLGGSNTPTERRILHRNWFIPRSRSRRNPRFQKFLATQDSSILSHLASRLSCPVEASISISIRVPLVTLTTLSGHHTSYSLSLSCSSIGNTWHALQNHAVKSFFYLLVATHYKTLVMLSQYL